MDLLPLSCKKTPINFFGEPIGSLFLNMNSIGRQIITTTYREITRQNLFEVIEQSLVIYRENAADCDFLLNYDAGVQPLQRTSEKKVMDWIDQEAVDNVAHEISDFWLGHGFSVPFTYVQRGDNGVDKADGIRNLNNYFYAAGSSKNQQRMGNFIVKCGHCYALDEINKEWEEGDSYFTRNILDPRNAFVVRSLAYSDLRVVLGVSLSIDSENNIYATAYTKDNVFFIYGENVTTKTVQNTEVVNDGYVWTHLVRSGEKNPMGKIPITELYWTPDRTGVFENQIDALDNINLLVSDISNGFEQNIQAVWWANNVEFPTTTIEDEEGKEIEVVVKPKNGDWVNTASTKDGGNPSIQPLTIDYHLEDMQKSYTEQRQLALQRGHVPQRNETSGGSSGVAMDSASGWADAELVASARNEVLKGCLMEELRVVLAVLRESTDIKVTDPVLTIRYSDVEPNVAKPKNSDVSTKVNAISTLLSHGFELEDALTAIALFPDATQTISRSGQGVKRYQQYAVWGEGKEETAPNAERTMQDLSDQNSPFLNT